MIFLENLILKKSYLPLFLNFNLIHFGLLIMVYAIYASKFSLSSTSAMKIYINLEILEVAKIIDKCIFLKFIIKKKSLINGIYLLSHKISFTKHFL